MATQENEVKIDAYMKQTFTPRIRADLRRLRIPVEDDHVQHVKTGGSLFIKGATGSGKTLYAAALMVQMGHFYLRVNRDRFISVPELLDKIRTGYGVDRRMPEQWEAELFNFDAYMEAGLLALDDLGCERATDWTVEKLYLLINHRYEHMRSTIFTSNLTGKQLAAQLGDRIPSRLEQMCQVVDLGQHDHRVTR